MALFAAGSEKCPANSKLPNIKATGNIANNSQANMDQQNLTDCFDILWSFPDIRGECLAYLRQSVERRASTTANGGDGFQTVSVFSRIDETFMAQWVANQLGVAVAATGKSKVHEPQFVRHAAQALLNIGGAAQEPESCKSRAVLTAVLNERSKGVDNRRDVFTGATTLLTARGAVAWINGVYKLDLDKDGHAATCTHRPSRTTVDVPDDVPLDNTVSLVNNHCDMTASVEKGHQKYFLKVIFGKGTGPHKTPQWSGKAPKFEECAAQCAAEIARTLAKQSDKEIPGCGMNSSPPSSSTRAS